MEGTDCNRSAIGTKLKISFRENGIKRTVYRELNSGGSFGASPLRREIGIGQAAVIDEIAITWTGSDKPEIFKNVKPNQVLKIRQGDDEMKTVKLKTMVYKTKDSTIPICVTPKIL